jgi:hypothetical protein
LDDAKRQEQKDFISKQLETNLADARQGLNHVYFVDAAHFVLQPFLVSKLVQDLAMINLAYSPNLSDRTVMAAPAGIVLALLRLLSEFW